MTDAKEPQPGDPSSTGLTPGELEALIETTGEQPSPEDEPVTALSSKVVFRDLVIFQVKLFLDGLGDLVLAPVSLVAFLWDMIPGGTPGRAFYSVLRLGERWDRWLTLYKPSRGAGRGADGLLEAGLVDANTFLGKVEEMVRPTKPPNEGP